LGLGRCLIDLRLFFDYGKEEEDESVSQYGTDSFVSYLELVTDSCSPLFGFCLGRAPTLD